MQPVEVKICHIHARMTEAIFSRLGGELILVFHVQSAPRLNPNHRRRVVASKAKFGFAGDWIRSCFQRHRRACLWQFRKYSVLPTGRGDKQPDACYPASGAEPEFLKHLHKTFLQWLYSANVDGLTSRLGFFQVMLRYFCSKLPVGKS